MKQTNPTDKNKMLHNFGIVLCIQIFLSLFSGLLEIIRCSTMSSCYAALFEPLVLFILPIAVPICIYLAARKCFVYPNRLSLALLCTTSLPILVLLVGFFLTASNNFLLQETYHLLNPMTHSFEYFLEIGTAVKGTPLSNPESVALCLAQLTEGVMLTLGMMICKWQATDAREGKNENENNKPNKQK